ncbi:exo-beta-N-acetylmuramidase NamZ domain-containing protein [Brevibacillus choshinensis]|uniref:exo-beta-N-acetylmuramidase NamZ domain-containing protein n=1 Tax=Brevibacillus choshinensis TaxID=54911 RepID=UPI002E23158A|nr:exo-beta-N-acetylmuramidase NamZ domain-containing protein [Brevibacillus choshinensis]MED4751401.1 DUF1343 domain-containing protein [Brevibacillus choshinensis]
MKKIIPFLILALILSMIPPGGSSANTAAIQLGSDVLFDQFHSLIDGKKVGLVTNQSGVNSLGVSTIDLLRRDRSVSLVSLFATENGLDGKGEAGKPVVTYKHPVYGIPVYSLNETSRVPTQEMYAHLDVLVIDLQDTGARTNPYITTLRDCMTAAKQLGKPVIVLDRPNPLGGKLVDGPLLEPGFVSYIGADTLPMAHGMTIGELSLFFNRNIGADLTVVPMQGYTRSMLFQDTGLTWLPNASHLPSLTAVFGYMATGVSEGTVLRQEDNYSWVGGEGIVASQYADLLNASLLPGVVFLPETKGTAGGVRLQITDPHLFNPAKTGMYALALARQLNHFPIPKSSEKEITLFDRMMGTNKIGIELEQEKKPQDIEASYAEQLVRFKEQRKSFLIYGDEPYQPLMPIHNKPTVSPQPEKPLPVVKPATPTETKPATTGKPGTPSTPKPGTPGTSVPAKPTQPAVKPPVTPPAGKPPVTPPATKPANPATDKVAYLTFDDGPSPVTPQVLDTLKKFGVKATFFIVGRSVAGHEAILKRTLAEGHAIGGHTYSHDYRIVYKSMEAFFADLERGNDMIEKAIGMRPTIFRYPGGSTNTVSHKYQDPKVYNQSHPVMNAIKAEANKREYTFIDWNVTNGDARSNKYTAQGALANIKQQVKSQKEIVILMHDASTKGPTAQALPEVITFLKSKGYRFDVIKPDHPTVSTVK